MVNILCKDSMLCIRLPESETVIQLSGTGRRIWEILEYPITLEEITRALSAEYSADIEKIAEETEPFLKSLCERELILLSQKKPSSEDLNRYRYLSLLKRSLMNLIYPEHELRISFLRNHASEKNDLERKRYLRDIRYLEPELYQVLIDSKQDVGFSSKTPYLFSHSMIGMSSLDNLERCAEIVFSENIVGDFLEAGVCQGGAAIFMRALQVAYSQQQRNLWAADSFQGLPKPKSKPDQESGLDFSETVFPAISFCLEGVRDNFLRYNLLDEGVIFVPGWFSETLHKAPIEKLAILRVDADLYSSTREVLENLYPKVTPGGFVIVDDYGALSVCRQAVDEYRATCGIRAPLIFVNKNCIYWRKDT